MRSVVEGVTAEGVSYLSTIESSFNGSPPHELRSQGGPGF